VRDNRLLSFLKKKTRQFWRVQSSDGLRSGALPLLIAVSLLIVGLALLTALLLFLLLPLFVLVLLPLTLRSLTVRPLTLRALTLAGLSLVSFVTHIEFSLAHRIYRPTEMQVR
jgi:positive regulator of sigma E activity